MENRQTIYYKVYWAQQAIFTYYRLVDKSAGKLEYYDHYKGDWFESNCHMIDNTFIPVRETEVFLHIIKNPGENSQK